MSLSSLSSSSAVKRWGSSAAAAAVWLVRAEVRKAEEEVRASRRLEMASGRLRASVERDEMCLTSFLQAGQGQYRMREECRGERTGNALKLLLLLLQHLRVRLLPFIPQPLARLLHQSLDRLTLAVDTRGDEGLGLEVPTVEEVPHAVDVSFEDVAGFFASDLVLEGGLGVAEAARRD